MYKKPKIGVYQIKCTGNNKVYVGGSICIQRRWKEHTYQLRNNRHHSSRLQNSWNKYGADKFEFSILEEILENELIQTEQKWIDEKEAFSREKGLNNRQEADTGAWSAKRLSKTYIITYPDGKEQTIKNLSKFCRDNGLNQGALSAVTRHKANHHKSYHCRLNIETLEQWQAKRQDYLDNRPPKKHPSKKRKSSWEITFPNGEKEVIKSLTDFCKQYNLSQGNMTEVAYGKRKQHKGFQCLNIDIIETQSNT